MTLWGRVIGSVVMVVGITAYGMVTAAFATWFVSRDQKRHHHLVQDAERAAHALREESAHALHERFDRIERLLDDRSLNDQVKLLARPAARG